MLLATNDIGFNSRNRSAQVDPVVSGIYFGEHRDGCKDVGEAGLTLRRLRMA